VTSLASRGIRVNAVSPACIRRCGGGRASTGAPTNAPISAGTACSTTAMIWAGCQWEMK